ncbi:hypothetical protein SLS62_003319 [Diatrype stigma]|uniref:Uncharacterized protein n=1 Tax=Diatrype stigma TaxID=117547 RepID=A0AAN9YUF9_9PEZI
MARHLAYWMKKGPYWKNVVWETGILDAQKETSNESQATDHIKNPPGVEKDFLGRDMNPDTALPPLPPFGGEYAKYLPQIYAKFGWSDEPIPVPYRFVNSEQGYWPSEENPCVCYLEENIAKYGPAYICGAIDHYRQPASSTTMFALTKDEVSTLSDLLLKMFKYFSKDRITIDEVLDHEYFDGTKEMFGDNSDVSEDEHSDLQGDDGSEQSDGENTQG